MRSEKKSGKETPVNQRRVYGRRLGRPLRKKQAVVLNTLLPRLSLKEEIKNPAATLDPLALYKTPPKHIWLEIGFGNGEHLAAQSLKNPDVGFMGAEPYINGMAAFLRSIEENPPENLRVLMDDALLLVHALKTSSIDKIYVLNPDPWHKKRHHKRRIVNPENLDAFARILKPGGELILTTDVADLAEWMITKTVRHPAFEWTARHPDDWRTEPPGWISTRYAKKQAKGSGKMCYLFFKKNAQ